MRSFPTLTLSELIDRYFRQFPAFLFGFHRAGVLVQKSRLYCSGNRTSVQGWERTTFLCKTMGGTKPPMNNTLMSLLPIGVEPALCAEGNDAGLCEFWDRFGVKKECEGGTEACFVLISGSCLFVSIVISTKPQLQMKHRCSALIGF